jgi:hypothetical protein
MLGTTRVGVDLRRPDYASRLRIDEPLELLEFRLSLCSSSVMGFVDDELLLEPELTFWPNASKSLAP